MATIKSFTDIEQSRKLAEILPIESADMFWIVAGNTPRVHVLTEPLSNYNSWENYPCWSLAALLDVLPNGIITHKDSQNGKYHCCSTYAGTYVKEDNPVDACVAMIERLHELKML